MTIEMSESSAFKLWLEELEKKHQVNDSKLFAVGRLDRDTTGLLLVTNSGHLDHALRESYSCKKIYECLCKGHATQGQMNLLMAGLELGDGYSSLNKAEILSNFTKTKDILPQKSNNPPHLIHGDANVLPNIAKTKELNYSKIRVEIDHGRYRVVRRIMKKVHLPVLELHRTQFSSIKLSDNENVHSSRKLSENEIDSLWESTGGRERNRKGRLGTIMTYINRFEDGTIEKKNPNFNPSPAFLHCIRNIKQRCNISMIN